MGFISFCQILSLAELRGVPFPTLKVQTLTVKTEFVRSVIPGISRLLQNSPGLKKLTLHTLQLSHDIMVFLPLLFPCRFIYKTMHTNNALGTFHEPHVFHFRWDIGLIFFIKGISPSLLYFFS